MLKKATTKFKFFGDLLDLKLEKSLFAMVKPL